MTSGILRRTTFVVPDAARAAQFYERVLGWTRFYDHSLVAKALDRVRRTLTRVVCPGLDHVADLLEHVDEHVLLERSQSRAIGAKVEPGEETEVDGLEIKGDPVASERSDETVRVRGGHRLRARGVRAGNIPSFRSDNPAARNAAIVNAAEARDTTALPDLVRMLESEEPSTRLLAFETDIDNLPEID